MWEDDPESFIEEETRAFTRQSSKRAAEAVLEQMIAAFGLQLAPELVQRLTTCFAAGTGPHNLSSLEALLHIVQLAPQFVAALLPFDALFVMLVSVLSSRLLKKRVALLIAAWMPYISESLLQPVVNMLFGFLSDTDFSVRYCAAMALKTSKLALLFLCVAK
jgi:hypothetical protein